uniref:Uncharacterized protein n=1 Tax=Cacopsylla melanoneura TaxID=428564 RepID=A0A8D9ED02_9HEMI
MYLLLFKSLINYHQLLIGLPLTTLPSGGDDILLPSTFEKLEETVFIRGSKYSKYLGVKVKTIRTGNERVTSNKMRLPAPSSNNSKKLNTNNNNNQKLEKNTSC